MQLAGWLAGSRDMRNIGSANQHDGYPHHHEPSSSKVPKECHCPISKELNTMIGGHPVGLAG